MARPRVQLRLAHADSAPMTAVGVDLTPICAGVPPIRMRREVVDVWLFPGVAVVEARFELENLGDACELEVGFPCLPVRDVFTPPPSPLRAFAVHVDGQRLPSTRRDHDNREFPCWYVWTQTFPAARHVVVDVRYWVPLVSYRGVSCAPFVYVLRTGRFWQGSIGEALVRVHAEGVPPEAILATTPAGSVREGATLVWRFVDLDPQQDIGLLVSPFAVLATKLGMTTYHDIVALHALRPAAGTPVVVGGYFDGDVLYGERRRDANIVIPAGLDALAHDRRNALRVRGLEQAQKDHLTLPERGRWLHRALVCGRVAYEDAGLVIEAELRIDVEGELGARVPERFAWVATTDEATAPRITTDNGAWPLFLERERARPNPPADAGADDDHQHPSERARAARGGLADLLVRVVGDSMQPRLRPGDLALALPWLTIRAGDLVVARLVDRLVIKEVALVSDVQVELRGWGEVRRDAIVGRVVLCWPPRQRG